MQEDPSVQEAQLIVAAPSMEVHPKQFHELLLKIRALLENSP
jgi:hypothetical protein